MFITLTTNDHHYYSEEKETSGKITEDIPSGLVYIIDGSTVIATLMQNSTYADLRTYKEGFQVTKSGNADSALIKYQLSGSRCAVSGFTIETSEGSAKVIFKILNSSSDSQSDISIEDFITWGFDPDKTEDNWSGFLRVYGKDNKLLLERIIKNSSDASDVMQLLDFNMGAL